MKKVRFESPLKRIKMDESECHSPRPFVQKQVRSVPQVEYLGYGPVPFSNDPVKRFEYGNSSPYPLMNRTLLKDCANLEKIRSPSNDLDLSILDSTMKVPVNAARHIHHKGDTHNIQPMPSNLNTDLTIKKSSNNILIPSNKNPPNILRKNDDFFLRRDNLNEHHQLGAVNRLYLDKENNPQLKKTQIMMMGHTNLPGKNLHSLNYNDSVDEIDESNCKCHHCFKACDIQHVEKPKVEIVRNQNISRNSYNVCHCVAMMSQNHCPCNIPPMKTVVSNCNCNSKLTLIPKNGVDKKTWAIQKYQLNKNTECLEVDKQLNISIDTNEPTVGDLFKIIKMQSEQLKLLQEKVDKVTSNTHEEQRTCLPIQNCVSEQIALNTIGTEHKISIGVMTSFEVVHTSTIINKEIVKQSEAQIQCNRSQISIKEVVSKEPRDLNFLDGLTPITKQAESHQHIKNNIDDITNTDFNVDKTLNEISLYNVEVDNAITPNMSPEQSLYLDVRDYSDSDASCDDESNVGWTYYNKVITHVNGMLHESDMPSSASALYRNVRQKCLQIQGDKSNISVAKRVTFGDDPLCLQKPNIPKPTTDTSLKMRQLAAKYLTDGALHTPSPRPTAMPVDMSLATRQYMEKHRILKGTNNQCCHPKVDIPKFLDITALKQQPKLL